jgi:hypothetical protein
MTMPLLSISLFNHTQYWSLSLQVIAYLVFTIISIIFAIALIACYSVSVGLVAYQEGSCKGLLKPGCPVQNPYGEITVEKECDIRVKLAIIIMFLSALEILAAIWAIFCCLPIKVYNLLILKTTCDESSGTYGARMISGWVGGWVGLLQYKAIYFSFSLKNWRNKRTK